MITINNKAFNWDEDLTIRKMLTLYNYNYPLIIVNINGWLIHQENYDKHTVPNNAKVYVIHLLNGG